MLRQTKLAVLRAADKSGASQLLLNSSWRRNRLLILCYHGVSMYDEHEWGRLHISPETFRRRLEILESARCNVLSLSQGLERLQDGTLPDRAVVLTFDDGFFDFYGAAFPILEKFGHPVTLYLTTYYVEFNRPVFDPMCAYLLWKARNKELCWPTLLPNPILLDGAGQSCALQAIRQFAISNQLSSLEKDNLLAQLAERVGVDYRDLCRRRVLHLIKPEEAKELAKRGVDLQFHTHRHRAYQTREKMFAELEENRQRLVTYTTKEPHHFCYTSGFYLPEYPRILREYGILSATTCEGGLCTGKTDRMLLPRFVDNVSVSDLEFRAWLSGTAALLPKRPLITSAGPHSVFFSQ
jgi:peptidoglycan/xylan/chitin deacetylase (PgdA/CDA1 family)